MGSVIPSNLKAVAGIVWAGRSQVWKNLASCAHGLEWRMILTP